MILARPIDVIVGEVSYVQYYWVCPIAKQSAEAELHYQGVLNLSTSSFSPYHRVNLICGVCDSGRFLSPAWPPTFERFQLTDRGLLFN